MIKKLLLIFIFFLVAFAQTKAQFNATTTPSITAAQIVQKFAGKGIVTSNATLSCPNGATGFFNNAATSLNMDSGIVLTTGNVLTYTSGGTTNYGINSGAAFSAKTDNQVTGGDADLIASAGVPSTGLHDLCKIEFDFVPLSDSIKFNYRFGSEEYPSFNCTNFSDIFAFYISGPGFVGNTNIALIPGTTIPVSVNSINDGSILYGNITDCNNLGAGSPFTNLYVNNAASTTIVYNGLTQLLQARAIVTPCSTYHMKIAIADLGDGDRDSGVFLDANSLTSEVATIEKIINPNSVTLSTPFVMEGCNPDTIYIKRPTAKPTPLVVGISTAGTASSGSDYICPTTVTIPANATTATFVVSANQDNIAEGTETIKLYIYGSPCVNIITDSATISLLEFPIYNVSDNDTICNGQCTNLSANIITPTPYLTFLWNPGNYFGSTYNVCPTSTSTYTCSAQYPGCKDRDSIVKITVAPLPTVNAGADVSICNGASTTLNGGVSNYAPYTISTQWTPTAGLNNSNVLNAIASPSNTTTYTLSATSSAGCTATDAMIVTIGAPISVNATTSNVLCNGAATGTATITASGTIGAVTYLLQPTAISNNTGIFSGLVASNYTVTITDAITCSKTYVFNINQAPIINIINTTALAPGCNGAINGSINISANGGTGAISYTLTPGNVNNTTGIFLNLNANTYTIICKDANLCTKSTVVIVTQPNALSFATSTKTNVTCNGLANGTITTNATGGTPGYSYTLLASNVTNITGFYNNLNVGTYTVNCTDNKGCILSTTLIITQPLGMAFNASITTSPTCAVGNNGAITNTVTGGAPSYSYNLTPGNITNITGAFSGLGIGAFVITATDANGCTKSNIVNLSFPNAPAFNTITSAGVSCNGYTNGSITATTIGGTGTITYSLLPAGTNGGVGSYINLAATTYTISATDASGCKTTSSVVVNTPLLLNIGSVVSSGVLCNNGASGTISINMAGGTPAYTFTANPGGATNSTGVFNSLATNTYTINIADSKGCTKSTTVFISNPTAINWVSVTKTNILCYNAKTGTITSSANGGTGTLTYSLQSTALSNTNGAFTGIGAGTYTLIVTDANGCTKSSIVVLTQPTDIISTSSNVTNATCVPGNDGSFTIASSGGIGPYTYSSSGVTNTTGNFVNQSVGGHATIVTDANGCNDTITVVITTPPAPAIGQVLFIQPKVCVIDSSDSVKVIMFIPGTFTFSINPGGTTNTTGLFTNLPSGNYVITVKDSKGCTANTNVMIQIPLPLQVGFNVTQPLCLPANTGTATVTVSGGVLPYTFTNLANGANNITGIFSNLIAGPYSIQIADSNGCKDTVDFNVNSLSSISLDSINKVNNICNAGLAGTIKIFAHAGNGALTYLLSNGNSNSNGIFNNLIAGTYTATVKDANNCTKTTTVTITEPAAIIIGTITKATPTCVTPTSGSFTITATGGTGALSYNANSINNATGIFTLLGSGTYLTTITDGNGCTINTNINLVAPNSPVFNTFNVTPILCNNNTNGAFNFSVNNGVAPYSYSYNASAYNTINSYSSLSAGNYTIVAKDNNQCTVSTIVSLVNPAIVAFSNFTNTNATCFGAANAVINATATGGTGPFTYLLNGGFSNTSGNYNTTAGTFTITAKDANNCIATSSINITQPNAILLNLASSTVPTCVPNNNGAATLVATNGVGSFIFNLSGIGNTSNGVYTSLIANIYTATATDGNNCSTTILVNLPVATPPVFTSITNTGAVCNGGSNGSSSIVASGGTGIISYNINYGNVTNISGIFNNLPASNYNITITDAIGCTNATVITITQPNQFYINLNSNTTPACNALANGAINVNSVGGVGTVTYLINPTSVSNTTGNFINLLGNNYTIQASDTKGCIATIATSLIAPAGLVWNSFTNTNVLCRNANTATLNAYAIGGTGTITYTVNPGGASNTSGIISNLSAGTFTLTATDANGCSITQSAIITQPTNAIILNNASSTVPTCIPGNDAVVTASASGGTGIITYALGSLPNNITGLFTNVGVASYVLTVTDANNCTTSQLVNVSNPNSPTAANIIATNTTCNGGANGSITLGATGGLGNIQYSLFPNNAVNFTGLFNNLTALTYTITLLDSVGCSSNAFITIGQPTIITFNSSVTSTALCFGNTGNITTSASGGTGTKSYTLLPNNVTNTTGIFNNFVANTYTIQALDAAGCTGTTIVSIATPPALYWSAFNSGNVSCFNGFNGLIVGNARGGTGDINYVLNPGNIADTSGLYFNLSANIYTIVATDANGCTLSSVVNVSQPLQLSFSTMSATTPTCTPGNDAVLTTIATGGTPIYQYKLNNNAYGVSGTFNNLGISIYTITIKDSKNCTFSQTINIANPIAPSITNTNISTPLCNGNNNGSLQVVATGGTGTLTYKLLPNNVSNTNGNFTSLNASSYTVSITDINACSVSTIVLINQPLPLQFTNVSKLNPLCFGTSTAILYHTTTGGTGIITYTINPGNIVTTSDSTLNLVANTYTIIAADANSCSISSTIIITNPLALGFNNFSITNLKCFNSNNGIVTTTVGGGTGILNYILNPGAITYAGTGFDSLVANITYTVTITDANACSIQSTTTLTQPTIVAITSLNSVPATCSPGGDGNITGTATGGTGTITFGLNGWPNNTTGIFNSINNANYTITATDVNGCSSSSALALITPNGPTFASINTTQASCNPNNNATATINAANGTAPYSYKLNTTVFGVNNIFNNLSATTYTATIKDANGCSITSTFNITTTVGVAISNTTINNVTCFGNANGTTTVVAGVGLLPYNFTLLPNNVSNANGVFNNLNPNTYTINIIDANGCVTSTTIIISQPNVYVFNTITASPPLCFGGANGSITTTVIGGTSPSTYVISPNIGSQVTAGSFTALIGNTTYTITGTDAQGCKSTTTVLVTQPTAVAFTSLTKLDVTCNGAANGKITALAAGGVGLITYTVNPGAISNTTGIFNALSGNTFTITITDANACTTSSSIFVYEPSGILINSNTNTPVTCNAQANGTVTIVASGGVGVLSYNLMPYNVNNTSGIFNNLGGATFTITIKDTNNCTKTATSIVFEPSKLKMDSAQKVNIICNGNANGSIKVFASGGNGNNSYSITPNILPANNTGIFTPLTPNNYIITVTDIKGCSSSTIVTISQPTALQVNIDSLKMLSCNAQNDGAIYTSGSGGSGIYAYTILPQNGSNSSGDFFNLSSGTYSVVITDGLGCTNIAPSINITQPPPIIIDNVIKNNVVCYSNITGNIKIQNHGGAGGIYIYGLQPGNVFNNSGYFDNLAAQVYTISITDASNCSITTSVTIAQNNELLLISVSYKSPTCNNQLDGSISFSPIGGVPPLTFSVNGGLFTNDTIYNNVGAGTYSIVIKDSAACTNDTTIVLTQPDSLKIDLDSTRDIYCVPYKTGAIYTHATGGNNSSVYAYYCNPVNAINGTGNFSNLGIGAYTIVVADYKFCTASVFVVLAQKNVQMKSNIVITPVSCWGEGSDAALTASASDGYAPYKYEWNTVNLDTSATLDSLSWGYYSVTITDTFGCVKLDTAFIEPSVCCELFMPNAFTPNNDKQNDVFRPKIGGTLNNLYYAIYDRWGNKVYNTADPKGGWDGTYNGQQMDMDTYYYILEYNCTSNKNTIKRKGDLLLIK